MREQLFPDQMKIKKGAKKREAEARGGAVPASACLVLAKFRSAKKWGGEDLECTNNKNRF